MNAGRLVGILGGTFDPVHEGHLAAAAAAADAVGLDEVLFIASHEPPHRRLPPRASAYHRFAMVSMAVTADARFSASDLELRRTGPSFTADTLRRLHAPNLQAWQLFFITGTDAFAEIATWHDYPALLDLANFVVISRPGQTLDKLASRLPDLAQRMQSLATGDWRPQKASTRILLVEAATPDVSSTEIRERLAAGGALTGLVPSSVESHIRRHRLYDSREGGRRAAQGDC
ncbi:MAG: nicotinate-nucleotide adenylyltransferase [Acidobacteria bacterium]|nr:MAG: nicotinate-nucleotide adenylyltransferase [Acidobacteriota bacterium]